MSQGEKTDEVQTFQKTSNEVCRVKMSSKGEIKSGVKQMKFKLFKKLEMECGGSKGQVKEKSRVAFFNLTSTSCSGGFYSQQSITKR